jgi:filamentous hemagglutinin family protein
MKSFLRIIKFTKNCSAVLAIASLILQQFIFVASATAQALPIIPDGSTNTQITQTASGIDQINIATPNANGLSHNKFSDYNVNESGQIINNFSGKNSAEISAGSGLNAVTQTQIGGLVVANPNLNSSGSAKIILNEVTSGNISQLLGYVEIAGTNADLILANPNGIMCRGCGFINTARLLNVAGNSNFDANNNHRINQHNLLQSYNDMLYRISEAYLYIFYTFFVLIHQTPISDVSGMMGMSHNLVSHILDIPVDHH